MPQRKLGTHLVKSTEVQGEGSFVEFRRMTWGEQKAILRKFSALDGTGHSDEQIAETEKMIVTHFVAWNWVDDRGAPMPSPVEAGLDALRDDEIVFLVDAIKTAVRGASGELEKN